MLYWLGRMLQIAGLCGTLYGLWFGATHEGALMDELLHLAVGFVVFSLGTGLLKASNENPS